MLDAETALERQRLYAEGLADTAIARRQGVDRTAVRDWRRRNGLPANPTAPRPRKPRKSRAKPKELHVRRCHLSIVDEAKRREMYDAGMADSTIAAAVGMSDNSVREWRIRANLPANFLPGRNSKVDPTLALPTPDLKRRAIALFMRGVGVQTIAREIHAAPSTLSRWRAEIMPDRADQSRQRTRGKPTPRHPNGRAYSKMLPERRARAFVLYADGKDDGEIAREMGLYRRQIWEWRHALFLPAIGSAWRNHKPKPKPKRLRRAITPMSNSLHAAIVAAIGRGLAPDLLDDAASDIWLAIAEGRLSPDDIRKQAGHFRNKVVANYASRFGPRSLDEEIGDGDGLRMIDMLKDDSSSDWLEEMGATVW